MMWPLHRDSERHVLGTPFSVTRLLGGGITSPRSGLTLGGGT